METFMVETENSHATVQYSLYSLLVCTINFTSDLHWLLNDRRLWMKLNFISGLSRNIQNNYHICRIIQTNHHRHCMRMF